MPGDKKKHINYKFNYKPAIFNLQKVNIKYLCDEKV